MIKKSQVKIDAVTQMAFNPPKHIFNFVSYFPRVYFTKYEDRFSYRGDKKHERYQKVLYKRNFIQPQWKRLKQDLVRLFNPSYVISRLAYALGLLTAAFLNKEAGIGVVFGVVTFDAVGGPTEGESVTSVSFSHTCSGSDRVLIVGVGLEKVRSVTGVTYAGVAMTSVLNQQSVADDSEAHMWRLTAPATGANTCEATQSAAGKLIAGAVSFNGSDGTIANATGATGNSTAPSVTFNAGTASDMGVDIMCIRSLNARTVTANDTGRWTNDTNGTTNNIGGGQSTIAGANSVIIDYTLNGAVDWTIIGAKVTAGVQPVAAGGNNNLISLMGVGN